MLNNALKQKTAQAKLVIEDTFEAYPTDQCLIAWCTGKDSTLLLRLILDVCLEKGFTPPPTLDIDQDDQFDELTRFRDQLIDHWGVKLLLVRNNNFLDKLTQHGERVAVSKLDHINQQALLNINYQQDYVRWEPDSPVCNHLLKTVPINQAIEQYGIKAMFTGSRWDEHGARGNETYFSPRSSLEHMRIHPILHLTGRDAWEITHGMDIPHNSLYQLGYRLLGSKTGTKKPAEIQAWEQDLEGTSVRGGRNEEKVKVMAQLRTWRYM